MAEREDLDASSSAAALFAFELRRKREERELSQDGLGDAIGYTGGQVRMVEAARRTPSRAFAEQADKVLESDGLLTRLWPLVQREALPPWFRGFAELENAATEIRVFEPTLVPGLLQTEGYIRALVHYRLGYVPPEEADKLVASRANRQEILTRANPPVCTFILDEAVLRRLVGNRNVMRQQLARLLEIGEHGHVFVQVVPFDVGEYPGLDGNLAMLSLPEGKQVAYVESYAGTAVLMHAPEQVSVCSLGFDAMRSVAFSPRDSAKMIRTAMEELA
jgi:transcriptional regulator with XRE-family HTH domain